MKNPRSKSKPKPKHDYYELSHSIVCSLVEAKLSPDECTYILVLSLATVLANSAGTRTVQDVIDRWRRVSEGSEPTIRTVASNIIDRFCKSGGYQ